MKNLILQEARKKVAVFTYGRNNPPTIGHEKLFDKTMEVANSHGVKPHIFTSHSQDEKKNPLSAEHKVKLIQSAYPDANVGSSSREMPSLFHLASHLYNQGHRHLVMVAGSDRVKEYQETLNKYNGVPGRHGMYKFDSISVVSAGRRDPDSDDPASKMSGTLLRTHASSGNKKAFHAGLMSKLSDEDKEGVYKATRKAMGLNEIYDPYLKISKYQWGEVEGTNHMKKMTPGETTQTSFKPFKRKIKENQIPVLLQKIREQHNMNLSFDGITTKNYDQCPSAYKEFSKMIATVRAGGKLGEPAGHPGVPAPESQPVLPQQTKRQMQFRQYLDI